MEICRENDGASSRGKLAILGALLLQIKFEIMKCQKEFDEFVDLKDFVFILADNIFSDPKSINN